MNCPSCGSELLAGKLRVWKSPWRFVFNWIQSHLSPVFVTRARRKTLLKFPKERSGYFCPKCHTVVLAPRVGGHASVRTEHVSHDRTG